MQMLTAEPTTPRMANEPLNQDGFGKVYLSPSAIPGSKILASASMQYNGVVMTGMKVINGEKGLFVAPPSQKIGDRYFSYYFFVDQELRRKITEHVIGEYRRLIHSNQPNQPNQPVAPPTQEGGQDDIPF